jgi:DNA-binding MarR family transcriptional regulator
MIGPELDTRFRLVTWIGIIDQLASTKANRVLAPLDLPLPQWVVLNHITRRGRDSLTVTAIARALQQPQPGVTKTIQKLEAKGWLRAQPAADDGRVKVVALTPAGRDVHGRAVTEMTELLQLVFADWTTGELNQAFELLDRLKLWLDAERD